MNSPPVGDLPQQVQTLRIILFAMAMGLMMFCLIVNFFLGPAEVPADETSRMTVWLVLCAGLVALVIHRVVGSVVSGQGAKNLPAEEPAARRQLLQSYTAGFIVSLAILEGAGFLCLLFYGFIVGDPILLAMAGLLWMAIVVKFPFPDGVEAWVEHQLRVARETR